MSDPRIEAAARVLAELGPGDEWPTNEELGGNLTGTRDDEYRAAMLSMAADIAAAMDAAMADVANARIDGDSGVRHPLEGVAAEFGVELDPEHAEKMQTLEDAYAEWADESLEITRASTGSLPDAK